MVVAKKAIRKTQKGPAFQPAPSVANEDDTAEALAALRKAPGNQGAQVLGSEGNLLKIRGVIPTGAVTLDAAIGRGGIPCSRLSILHGGEGSGKTTLALQIVANTQQQGGLAMYWDKEFKLDPDYARALGCDLDRMIISQPGSLEDVISGMDRGLDYAAKRRKKGKQGPILFVLDSINAAKAACVLNGEATDSHVAPEARIWSNHLPKLIQKASTEDVALLFISQVRKKIGVLFGNDETIAGGQAPPFYASLIMYVRYVGAEKVDNVRVANKIEVECKKNQVAPPFRKGKFLIRYGRGTDWEDSLIKQAELLGIVKKKGAVLAYKNQRIGQGYLNAAKSLRKRPKWAAEIEADVKAKLKW